MSLRARRFCEASLLLLCLAGAAPLADDLGEVGDFALTERGGETVRKADLLGKIWIASFEFTRCTAGCPQISATMERLQTELKRHPDVRLVTFTVDPDRDGVAELREYAERYHADPKRWLFLTGEEKAIYPLLEKSFHLPAQKNKDGDSGNAVLHTRKLVLVDRNGHIRGYYEGMPGTESPTEAEYEAGLRKLKAKIAELEHRAWYLPRDFPRFNASLNAVSAMLLLLGFTAIRRRLVRLHVLSMLSALLVSTLFLTSYLYYHGVVKHGESTTFAAQTSHLSPPPPAWVGVVYQIVLWTHIPLAALVVPLALFTAYQGLRGRFARHVRIARWTLPIWLYVSITGVAVYWMLYRLYPLP